MTPPFTTFRPYQVPAMAAILDSALNNKGLTFTVVMARQAGKNEMSANIELHLLCKRLQYAVDIVKCAPTFHPQGRISMLRLWSRINHQRVAATVDTQDGRAVRIGRARAVFLSAEPNANVAGHTASLMLEVDEAQDVDPDKFDRDFRPMASSTGATTVYYGTPWDDSTLLERAVQHNLQLERRDGVRRHFAVDWTVVAETNPDYARYVEEERARLGENHPMFVTQYALKPLPGAGRLFSASQRAQLQGTHPRQRCAAAGETYVAGLDIGGQAFAPGREHDATVLTIARVVPPASDALLPEPRLEVVEQIAFTGVPHDGLFAQLADLLGRVWGVRSVAVDATGLGETLARLLERSLGGDVVRSVKITRETKSNMGYAMLAAVNGGRLRVYAGDGSPEYAEFWREAEAGRVAYHAGRQMTFHVDPRDGHDDYLSSLALTVEAARDIDARPRIARGRVPVLN